jgi:hypothetical protein
MTFYCLKKCSIEVGKDSSGIGFGEYGGDLEIHQLDLKQYKTKSSTLLGKTKSR